MNRNESERASERESKEENGLGLYGLMPELILNAILYALLNEKW